MNRADPLDLYHSKKPGINSKIEMAFWAAVRFGKSNQGAEADLGIFLFVLSVAEYCFTFTVRV